MHNPQLLGTTTGTLRTRNISTLLGPAQHALRHVPVMFMCFLLCRSFFFHSRLVLISFQMSFSFLLSASFICFLFRGAPRCLWRIPACLSVCRAFLKIENVTRSEAFEKKFQNTKNCKGRDISKKVFEHKFKRNKFFKKKKNTKQVSKNKKKNILKN